MSDEMSVYQSLNKVSKALKNATKQALENPTISMDEKFSIVAIHGETKHVGGPTSGKEDVTADIGNWILETGTDFRADLYDMWDDVFERWKYEYCFEYEDLGPLSNIITETPEGDGREDEEFSDKLTEVLSAFYINEGVKEVCYYDDRGW